MRMFQRVTRELREASGSHGVKKFGEKPLPYTCPMSYVVRALQLLDSHGWKLEGDSSLTPIMELQNFERRISVNMTFDFISIRLRHDQYLIYLRLLFYKIPLIVYWLHCLLFNLQPLRRIHFLCSVKDFIY